MKKRSQIAEKYKWNLKAIYATEEELTKDIDKIKEYPKRLAHYKGKLKKVNNCLEFFELSTECSQLIEKIEVYISLKLSEDLEDSKYLELSSRMSYVAKDLSVATSFEESELLSYGEKYIKKLLNDERFKNYSMSLKNVLRNKEHILTEEQEILLSKAMKSLSGYSDVYDNINTLDLKFEDALDSKNKKHEVNQHNYSELMESKDRTLRKNAHLSMIKGYHSLCNTIATNYIGSVESDWFIADMYRHKSVLEMSLFGENIPENIYHSLLKNINENLKLMHRYYKLKQKALGLQSIYFYDIHAKINSNKKNMNYEESYDAVINAMSVLGDEYIEGLKIAKDNRWIDVFPSERKEALCFACSIYKPHPYVLLNTMNDEESVYTLAHELGHAMHDYLSAKYQPYQTYDHTAFLAEIASTVNEVLLFKYLYQNSKSNKDKLSLMSRYLRNIFGSIYVQSLYSEFELYSHGLIENGEPISKEILNIKWTKLVEKYYGKSMKRVKEDVGETWMRIPHFYRPYYVYTYATGMISAINFASRIISGNDDAKEKYLEFLKAGTKDYSTEILKNAGVDLENSDTYNIVFNEIKWALDEMEKLI